MIGSAYDQYAARRDQARYQFCWRRLWDESVSMWASSWAENALFDLAQGHGRLIWQFSRQYGWRERNVTMPGIGDLRTAAIEAESWVDELTRRLGWRDRERGYLVLVATLHALRDSLPRQEVVFIGAQLPALLRGVYYDGWHGDGGPASRNRTAFLARVHDGVRQNPAVDPEEAARAVFATIAAHLPATELEEAKAATPSSLHTLWPS